MGVSFTLKNADPPDEEPEEYVFVPKRIDIDSIVIYGRKGNITLDAIRWLIKL